VRCIFAFEIWRRFQRRMGCIVRGPPRGHQWLMWSTICRTLLSIMNSNGCYVWLF
jgi:hypothetical protein